MINGWQCGGLNEEDELSYEELMYIKQCYADAVQDELNNGALLVSQAMAYFHGVQ